MDGRIVKEGVLRSDEGGESWTMTWSSGWRSTRAIPTWCTRG